MYSNGWLSSHPITDLLPMTVKYYPTWLPFSDWKRRALEAGKLVKVMFDYPYNKVKKAMVRTLTSFW